jgi:hypothetical protein
VARIRRRLAVYRFADRAHRIAMTRRPGWQNRADALDHPDYLGRSVAALT